ncbi:MAG: fructosamine kinase family protein [Anaerolineae bacterium]|nr:MAG: fructosamine kinase family protein [Anaerolineae bacterium]
MTTELTQKIQRLLDQQVRETFPLSVGSTGTVYKARLDDGLQLVAKVDQFEPERLDIEAWMLGYLREASQLPVPEVILCADGLLLLEFIQGESRFSTRAEEHAAELLAALHNIPGPTYGFEADTLIGSLPQPNPPTGSWVDFFGEHRLHFMANEAYKAGRLPKKLIKSIDALCNDLDRWLIDSNPPGLIHGDAWTGNILCVEDRITGFIDPAVYYADPEIELAFTTLFGTFGKPFFDRYQEIRPLNPGFFEERKAIYNLYPLLVHVRLFGGSYVNSVAQTLSSFGY